MNVILCAWRSIRLGVRDVHARVSRVRCDECLRVIRWWNRRVRLVDRERFVHLQCWRDQLFLRAFVAERIRSSQIAPGGIRPPRQDRSQPNDHGSADDELLNIDEFAAVLRDSVEQLQAQHHPAEELVVTTRLGNNQRHGSSSLSELGQRLWYFLTQLDPPDRPGPPRL